MRSGASRAVGVTFSVGRLQLIICAASSLASSASGSTAPAAATAAAASSSAPAPLRRLRPAAALPPRVGAASSALHLHSPTVATVAAASAGGSQERRSAPHAAGAAPRDTTTAAAAAAPSDTSPPPLPPAGSTPGPPAQQANPEAAAPTAPGSATRGSGNPDASAAAAAAAVTAPQLPLCRRPAVHVDEMSAALAWKAAMADRISQLGNSLEQRDGGPDMAGLLRELDWVLDDVIEAVRVRPDAAWEATSWRMLEPRVRAEVHRAADPRVTSAWQLRLREPLERLWEWWERRLRDRVPFQYLISSAHWHRYVLSVGPGVLIPRPETEIFPDLVREAISARPSLAAAPWADLGTGSGAIAIAAAEELRRVNPAAEVWAVDLSPAAVATARFNARLCLPPRDTAPHPHPPSQPPLQTANSAGPTASPARSADGGGSGSGGGHDDLPVRVVLGSWFEPLRHLTGRLGGVLSNPPYIPRREMLGLQAEVGLHEPRGALDGGEGPGLDSLQELCAEAAAMLAPGGLIALETAGGEQANLVADLLRTATLVLARGEQGCAEPREGAPGPDSGSAPYAFVGVEVLPDCYGVRRFVRAYRAD